MKSNTIIRVISAVMSAGILLTACGCGGKKAAENLELNQPVVKDSTAVIEYTSKKADGKEVAATTIADVESPDIDQPVFGLTLTEKFEKKGAQERFMEDIKSYDIDEKEAKKIVEKAADWQTFTYSIYVANSNASRIAFQYITHESVDGIEINNDLGCEYGVPSGYGMTILIDGIVDKSKIPDELALREALSKSKINILYTYVKSMDDTVDDWNAVETKKMAINFEK